MKSAEIDMRVDLGRGPQRPRYGAATSSYDYVKINADYRS